MTDKFTSKRGIDRLESHFVLAASCLIAGLSHGVTIRMDNLEHVYAGLGLTEQNVHAIGHGTGSNGRSADECRDVIRAYHIKLIAGLAAKLRSIPEGGGTMLDNTMDRLLQRCRRGASWSLARVAVSGGWRLWRTIENSWLLHQDAGLRTGWARDHRKPLYHDPKRIRGSCCTFWRSRFRAGAPGASAAGSCGLPHCLIGIGETG